jgi:CheY-like chemotaxis protein
LSLTPALPLLQKHGFDVRVAATVPEAVAEIENHTFDVLLSDINISKDGDGDLGTTGITSTSLQ